MNTPIDATHDPDLKSWLESANDLGTEFPIQNLPFGRFRRAGDADSCIGVAIGDQVLAAHRLRRMPQHRAERAHEHHTLRKPP